MKRTELATFLGLTFVLSGFWWWRIVAAGGLEQGGVMVLALMWMPGLSAVLTFFLCRRTLRGLGWKLPHFRWALVAYLLPLAYGSFAYGAVWLTGLGGLDLSRGPAVAWKFLLFGSLIALLAATGEEIGWRGYLVPALARSMPVARVALISGLIWALWHMPLIVLADYNAGTATWYALLCFTLMVVAISVPMAWLRLRSASLWPAAILHASHNLFVQGFFDQVTVDTGPTPWWSGEFGAALVVALGVVAWLFWRARAAVEQPAGSE